ncbi:hypothetical protein DEF28_16635 [Marinitenerispora sediminis]|nr:hypothetical protein DEF28_16635 [Marinitenerispora sediminis]
MAEEGRRGVRPERLGAARRGQAGGLRTSRGGPAERAAGLLGAAARLRSEAAVPGGAGAAPLHQDAAA